MTNKTRAKTRASKPKEKQKSQKKTTGVIRSEILSIVFFMLAVFTYVSISKYQGMPENTQFIGLLGKYIMKSLEVVLGQGAIMISFYLLFWSIHAGISKKLWSLRMWGGSLLFLSILMVISIYDIPGGINSWEAGLKGMGGGYLGGGIAFLLMALFGKIGIVILLFLTVLVSAIMIIDKPFVDIIKFLIQKGKILSARISSLMFYENNNNELVETVNNDVNSDFLIIDNMGQVGYRPETDTIEDHSQSEKIVPVKREEKEVLELFTEEEKQLDSMAPAKDSGFEYQKPPLDILSDINNERSIDKKNIKESISVLEDTFSSFGIGVKVNQVSCGPAVTRYELTPAPGVKVSKIISLTDDLQLNLAAPGIRIEAPIPGKSAIGIEVPNKKILSVGLRSLLSSVAFQKLNSPLGFALGEDISGNIVVGKLSDMPHLLIAGSTGSGKSVCINSIIMMFLFNSRPEDLKMVFIDPKMVELTVYNGIPHLMTPVVTDPKKAAVILRWMVTEMEKRYRLFADRGVRDIQRYNQVAEEKMPFIVIIIDELADLMMVAPVEVEDSICRLAQMARAAGMHLIVATQRPSVDVVTGVIKANIPSRIAFAVSSQADSRTILDCSGAEKLLGKGDMLFFPLGANKALRVQGAYVSDEDIENTVNFIKEQSSGVEELEQIEDLEISLKEAEQDYGDDLFWDAVKVFVDNQKASVSLLQRRLRIGYARAARLVDLMEDRGIVSELDNNKKREILIDKEYVERVFSDKNLC